MCKPSRWYALRDSTPYRVAGQRYKKHLSDLRLDASATIFHFTSRHAKLSKLQVKSPALSSSFVRFLIGRPWADICGTPYQLRHVVGVDA